MNRRLSWLLIGGLLALAGLYFEKYALPHKSPPKQVQAPPAEEPQPEIKAATPEDPGPIATVISPLHTWTKDTKLAQTEPPAAVSATPHAADHVTVSAPLHPENFLHGTFPVSDYVRFEFEVPRYVKSPRLYGRFRSSRAMPEVDLKPAENARMEVLLLTAEELQAFLQRKHCTATRAAGPAASQSIDWALSATSREPRKYYLIFRNPDPGQGRQVEADFTVSSE